MDQHQSGAHDDFKGLWDWNLASNRIHFSPRWISLVGCEDHEVGNAPEEWLQRVHPEDLDQVLREIKPAQAEGPSEFDFRHRLRHKDGTYRWLTCHGVVVRNADGQVIRLMGSHSDVTAETVTDLLTGLPNRLLFLDRLTGSIEQAQRYQGFHFAVLLVDLGRPAGSAGPSGAAGDDPVLPAAARRLETYLRSGDTTPSLHHNDLVARLHGDQFAVLLDGLKDVSHAKVIADRILEKILAPFNLSGRQVFLSASIGIAVSATGYVRVEDVLRDAEIALHRARVLGASRCEFFDTAVLKSEQAELQLEDDLKHALERREFQLCYQPIVSLASNQILGFEALVRWQHPGLGMIPPLDFIPMTERTGFIVPLGNWILREACLQLRAWQESLPGSADLWLSVNLSGVQLRDADLIQQISDALRDSALEPRCLVLELTEGVAMENPTAVKTVLMQLRAMGVRISIDDFGTGYSSLAYLSQFPVDALKVDRSFVRGMETHKDTADIVGALTGMAQKLGLQVVAEGIENEEQVALLRSLHCESAQGYLFAEPLDVNRATDLLKTGLTPRPASAGTEKPAPFVRPEERMPERQDGTKPFPKGRWLSVAAAVLLLSAGGLLVRLTKGPTAESSSLPALENAEQGPRLGTPADAGIPIRTPDVVAVSPVPEVSDVTRRKDLSAEASVQQPAVPKGDAGATPRPGPTRGSVPTRASVPTTPRPEVQELTSLKVVHLHRVGSCHGRLLVSREGVTFVPDEKSGKDNFAFKHSEFLSTLAENTLTLKTNTRTYRFKTIAAVGEGDNGSQLQDLVEGMARFR